MAGILTLIFALATPLVSTATRGLWQHGPVMLCYCATLLLLLAGRTRPSAILWAAIPVAFAVICRPWAGAFVFLVSVHLLLHHRRQLLGFLAIGGAIALVWIACYWMIYGAPLPNYYKPGSFQWRSYITWSEAMWGPLLSPSRGLLVWCPFLLFGVAALVDRVARRDPLVQLSAAMLLAQWVLAAVSPNWFGGHSVGPRLMSDALPFCFVLLLPAATRLAAGASPAWRLARPLALLSVLFAGWVHLRAAGEVDQVAWNYLPTDVGKVAGYDRLWDWRDPQFLRGTAFSGLAWANRTYHVVPAQQLIYSASINSRHPELDALLRDGWSGLEDWGVWSSGGQASLAIPWSAIPKQAETLSLAVRPFLAVGLGQQRVQITLGDGEARQWSLERDAPSPLTLPLPPRQPGQAELLVLLELPDARSPASLGLSQDRRLLAVGLLGLRFAPP